MIIEPTIATTESAFFADVKDIVHYKDKQKEFFSYHTVFKIDCMEQLHDDLTNRL